MANNSLLLVLLPVLATAGSGVQTDKALDKRIVAAVDARNTRPTYPLDVINPCESAKELDLKITGFDPCGRGRHWRMNGPGLEPISIESPDGPDLATEPARICAEVVSVTAGDTRCSSSHRR
jgi:hypothetical protein